MKKQKFLKIDEKLLLQVKEYQEKNNIKFEIDAFEELLKKGLQKEKVDEKNEVLNELEILKREQRLLFNQLFNSEGLQTKNTFVLKNHGILDALDKVMVQEIKK